MKRLIVILLFRLCFVGINSNAQQTEVVKPPTDKKNIELRPSTRDYGSVNMDNKHQPVVRPRDKTKFMNKRPVAAKPQQPKINPVKSPAKNEKIQLRKSLRR
jgi:hypothetical protein